MTKFLWLYGPLLYQNFWMMLIVNIHRLPSYYLNNTIRELHQILSSHFPEYT